MIPASFKVALDKQVTVCLRGARTTSEKDWEAIVDVNHDGRWIRGLELLGGSDFNLARAVTPFHPKRPSEAGRVGVTYDEEANAAFFYFSMKQAPPNLNLRDWNMGRTLVEPKTYRTFRAVLKSEGEIAAKRYLDTLNLKGREWAKWIEFSTKHSRSMTARTFLNYLDEPRTLADARTILGGNPSEADRLRVRGMGIRL